MFQWTIKIFWEHEISKLLRDNLRNVCKRSFRHRDRIAQKGDQGDEKKHHGQGKAKSKDRLVQAKETISIKVQRSESEVYFYKCN